MPGLPRSGARLTIDSFDGSLTSDRRCDLRRLKFIDAYGLVGTACALRAASDAELLLPTAAKTRSHLSVMGLRDFLATSGRETRLPEKAAADNPDVVVPLQLAADSGGAQALSNLLWEQLAEHVAPQVLNTIAEGVWEMVENALEHSGTDAVIMGQVYSLVRGGTAPDHDDRVQVVIGDTGRGIRRSFLDSGAYAPATDGEAIGLALEYLVTSVVGDRGRGQGLFTTMEQVVESSGRMVVRTGAARVSITATGRVEETVPPLPGVIVALSLPLYPG
jgi:anti-sigma regulatory factor (Ser/Thr protein kinase)